MDTDDSHQDPTDRDTGRPIGPDQGGDEPALAQAVGRGALVGTALLVPVVTVTAFLVDRSGEGVSPWRIPLFFGVLAAFGLGGFVAARAVPASRFTAGILAGLGAFALWLPLRALTWWIRDDGRGLVTGADAVLAPGQVLTAALFAATLGLVGGILGGSRRLQP